MLWPAAQKFLGPKMIAKIQAYDASRVKIPKVNDDPHETSMYSVASKTVGVRIQKAADPEVAALLNDSDLSQFGSDVEDLEEDFLVKTNLRDEVEDVEFDTKLNLFEISGLNNEEVSQFNVSHSHENAIDLDGADEVELSNLCMIFGVSNNLHVFLCLSEVSSDLVFSSLVLASRFRSGVPLVVFSCLVGFLAWFLHQVQIWCAIDLCFLTWFLQQLMSGVAIAVDVRSEAGATWIGN
ncbi:hypothetical protein U1Q18_002334 [Sarracenia purpurea var. burkii]